LSVRINGFKLMTDNKIRIQYYPNNQYGKRRYL